MAATSEQLRLEQVLREHHDRIRVLEAGRLAGDGGWVDFDGGVGFLNSWVDWHATHTISDVPKAGYRILNNGEIEMRGRLTGGKEGFPALQLPTAVKPTLDREFVCALSGSDGIETGASGATPMFGRPGPIGRVAINYPDGYLFGYMGGAGFGYLDENTLLEDFTATSGAPTTVDDPYDYGAANPFQWEAGGGLGISGAANGMVFYGTDRYQDAQVTAKVTADCSTIALGARCQHPFSRNHISSYPPGVWVVLPSTAHANWQIIVAGYTMNQGSYGGAGGSRVYTLTAATHDWPGFGNNDVLGFAMQGNDGPFYIFKNGALVFTPFSVGTATDVHSNVMWNSGYFGIGADGTHNVSLVKEWHGGMPRANMFTGSPALGIDLSSVRYKP